MAVSKLELTLEAIDRASGPMRKVSRAIGGIEDAAKDAVAPVSAVDKALDGIERASRPLGRTGKALEDIERAAEGAAAPVRAVDQALEAIERSARPLGQVERAMESIERAAQGTHAPLNSMERALDEVGRSSVPLGQVEHSIEAIERAARDAVAPIERMERAIVKAGHARGPDGRFLPRGMDGATSAAHAAERAAGPSHRLTGGALAGAAFMPPGMVSAAGVGFAGASVVTAAADFEASLVNIRKKAGISADETARLGEEIKGLATSGQLGVSIDEIAAAYDRGAASSIPLAELKDYATLTAKGADAFEMSSLEMGEFMGNLKFGLNQSTEEIERMLDLINALADAGKADERDVAAFVGRAGAPLKTLGLLDSQTAALGTTLLNIGMPTEVASTAMGTLSAKMLTVGQLSGKGRKTFERYMGSVSKFTGMVDKNPMGALLSMLDRLGELDKTDRMAFLTSFSGMEWSDEMLRIVEASGELRRNLALAEDESKWLGSLDASYALKLETFWAQWRLAKNDLQVAGVNLGTLAMPGIKASTVAARELVKEIDVGIRGLPSLIDQAEIAEARKNIGDLTTSLRDFLGIDPSGSPIADFFRDLAGLVNETAAAINKLTNPSGDIKAIPTEPAALDQMQYEGLKGRVRSDLDKRQGMQSSPLFSWLPDGVIGDRPSSWGMDDYDAANWDRALAEVKAERGLPPEPGPALSSAPAASVEATGESSALQSVLDALSSVADAIGSALVSEAGAAEMPPGSLPSDKGARVVPEIVPPDIVGPLSAEGAAATMEAIDIGRRIEEAASVTAAPIIDVSSIVGARAQVDALAGALRAISAQSRALPSPGAASASIPIDGARAAGGPVSAGGLYLVGEQGPELFSPGRGGMIHTAGDTQRLFGGEPRTRPDLFASGPAMASGSDAGRGGSMTVDASLHVGEVRFSTEEDKEEFETLLRRHAKTVADVVTDEARRESRRAF